MNSRFQLLAACIFLASCTATSLDVAQNHLDSHITYFHMNWGWGGYYNGYYYDNNIATGNGNYYADRQDLISIYH